MLAFVHEAGHFVAAKLAGVVVEEFGFGFPPRLLTLFERGGTKYSLNWIPFGAFVRLRGENDPDQPGSFASKSKSVRTLTLLGGAGMNFLLAFLLFTGSFLYGQPVPVISGVKIISVTEGSPAERAGLQADDKVLMVDGQELEDIQDFSSYTRSKLGQEVSLTIEREDEELLFNLTPRREWPEEDGPIGVLITSEVERLETVRAPLGEALLLGAQETGMVVMLTVYVPVAVLRGRLSAEEVRPAGPVAIVRETAGAAQQAASRGWWWPILRLSGFFSAALGFTNLLPIPALDGGRLLFILVEALRGRRIDPQREGLIHLIGFALMLMLLGLITYVDFVSPLPSIDWGRFGF
jgi:regulator of sigma E protease